MIAKTWIVGLLFAFVTVPSADAAMCIRLSIDPHRPLLGRTAIVQIRTYFPTPDGDLEPTVVRRYPFRVEAVSPHGRLFRIRVSPSTNRFAWRGTFRFNAVGVWTVRVRNFGPVYPAGCGERLKVRVRAS